MQLDHVLVIYVRRKYQISIFAKILIKKSFYKFTIQSVFWKLNRQI